MALVKTPRAIIDVLGAQDEDGRYPIVGHEVERFYVLDGEEAAMFAPRIQRDPATVEEVTALRAASGETLTEQLRTLNAALLERDAEIAKLRTRLQKAVQALEAVEQADSHWDTSARQRVTAVLSMEA